MMGKAESDETEIYNKNAFTEYCIDNRQTAGRYDACISELNDNVLIGVQYDQAIIIQGK